MDPEIAAKATPAFKPPRKRKKAASDLLPAPSMAGRKVLKTITEQLPVVLTKKEQRKLGQQLAHQEGELDNHEAHAQQVKSTLKAREADIRAQISALSMSLRQGTALRDVPVNLEADYEAGICRYVRQDTNEEIRTRPLATEERQETLFEPEEEPGTKHDPREPDIALPSGVSRAEEES